MPWPLGYEIDVLSWIFASWRYTMQKREILKGMKCFDF